MEHPLFSIAGTSLKAQFSLLHFTVNEAAGGLIASGKSDQ